MLRTSYKLPEIKNILFLVLFSMFVFGVLYGSLLVKSEAADLILSLGAITSEYAAIMPMQSILVSFISAFFSAFIFILIPYLLGYSAIGQPIALCVPLFHGLGIGCALGQLYSEHGIGGIGYSLLIIIPKASIALFAILIACRESIKLSNSIFKGFLPHSAESHISFFSIRLYNVKFLILTVVILAAAVVSVVCSGFFSGIFI